ncbi:MAG: radical SAM protein [Candidatus Melainabacteria bacterium]|nr:radical SAM protein [Candidatus Melainabacteria bacterium]
MLKEIKHSIQHIRLLLKRPAVLPRVLSGYFKALILHKNVLRVVEFVVNYECQSKCIMCFASKNRKNNQKPLSPDEIKNVWKQAVKLGAVAAVIEGGEATLRKDFFEIIKALDSKRNIINLITNSIGLDKNKLLEMRKAGLSVICFSLDDIDAENNDKIRGYKGHFDQVMRCIDWAKEAGLIVSIAPIFSHGQVQKVKKIIRLALEKECHVSASTAVVSGRWARQKYNVLDKDEWKEIRQIVKEYPQVRFDWNINYSLRYECPGGREKICIGIYGDVYGCATNPISFGNVRESSLENIWKQMHKFEYFKKRSSTCLVSEDLNYIQKFIDPISEVPYHPVHINEHPNQTAATISLNNSN